LPPGCSFQLPDILGVEVDDVQDDSCRGRFTVWFYLSAKHSHMGVDVDGLAFPLHQRMVRSYQMRGHGLLLGALLPCRCSGRRLLGDVKLPRHRYLMES
jgi:hypothetical protein